MKRKKHFKAVFISLALVGAVGAVAILGWISNAKSKALCLEKVGSEGLEWIGEAFFYLQDGDKDARVAFDSLGAKYTITSRSVNPDAWPRLAMKTRAWIPFLISVDYFWAREAQIGTGGTRWFFCFFGKTVEMGETDRFVS